MEKKKNERVQQHVDVDKNPMEVPGESLFHRHAFL